MTITYPPEMLPSPAEGDIGEVIVVEPNPDADIVARLRQNADVLPDEIYSWLNPVMMKAADEIARLRAALKDAGMYVAVCPVPAELATEARAEMCERRGRIAAAAKAIDDEQFQNGEKNG